MKFLRASALWLCALALFGCRDLQAPLEGAAGDEYQWTGLEVKSVSESECVLVMTWKDAKSPAKVGMRINCPARGARYRVSK